MPLATVPLVVGLIGCGSSAAKRPATSATSTRPSSSDAVVSNGPVHASFSAPNHTPTAGRPWPYSVHVTSAAGRPLSGSVKIQFTFAGTVVGTDKPPVHPVRNGIWHDNITFPPEAVGHTVTMQAVVHTSAGSVTLSWPVSARK